MKLLLSGILCIFLVSCAKEEIDLNSYNVITCTNLVATEFNTADVELLEKVNSWNYIFLVRDELNTVYIVRVHANNDETKITTKRVIFKGDD